MQGSANLNVMIKAARKAARALVKDFREVENLQVSAKGPGEFVSRADTAAEETLKAELMGARPNYGWLAEESGARDGADPTRRWIVDPLDGTTNFLHGMPHWSISMALEHKGEIVAGVIFDPAKDEMFFAEKGQGAWMNDFVTGGPEGESFAPHLGVICGNFTPPSDDRPALLTHREVQTIFHEFGHLLHHVCSRVPVEPRAGLNVVAIQADDGSVVPARSSTRLRAGRELVAIGSENQLTAFLTEGGSAA